MLAHLLLGLQPVAIELIGLLAGLHVGAVIHEIANGQLGRQLQHAAHVIGMIVGDDEIIDLLHAGVLGRGGNAERIAVIEAGPAGIDQHGFARRGDEQGRLAAFHVDKIDFHVLGGRQEGSENEAQKDKKYAHGRNRIIKGRADRRQPFCGVPNFRDKTDVLLIGCPFAANAETPPGSRMYSAPAAARASR